MSIKRQHGQPPQQNQSECELPAFSYKDIQQDAKLNITTPDDSLHAVVKHKERYLQKAKCWLDLKAGASDNRLKTPVQLMNNERHPPERHHQRKFTLCKE